MKFLLAIILICFTLVKSHAVDHEIRGFAPDFVGEKVELFTCQDYVTLSRIKLGEGRVNPLDSIFHISISTEATFKGVIELGKTEASIYVAPNTSYDVYFPAVKNQVISFQNRKTELIFFGLDSTDINYRVLQYNQWFDSYVAYHEKNIAKGQFLVYLDTFKIYVAEAYEEVKDEYFLTYVRYNIGKMEQAFGGNSKSSLRLETYLNYIEPFPVYYENDQYMNFFKGFYSSGFEDYMPTIEAEINMAIYYASPSRLMNVLKQDLFLSKPEIREMVMIDKLGKQYYNRNDQKRNILLMLDSLSNFASSQVNATIARNVTTYLTSLEPGFPAPPINFERSSESVENVNWKTYRGKFVYLNFFETWNDQAKTDMLIIFDLKKKYGDYVSFLSICTDKEEDSYLSYMNEHTEFDWDIFYVGNDSNLKDDYRLKIVPSYFLIDQSGFIALAPAPTPAPDGEYESIDKTFYFIKNALTPREHHGIGER